MSDKLLSIRQVSILTAVDRDTCTRRLQGLRSEPGPKNSRLFSAPEAIRAVLGPALAPQGSLEEIKTRIEFLNAQLKEITLGERTKNLISADFSFDLINGFIKFCAGRFDDLRRRGAIDRAWIQECENHWLWQYREFLRSYGLTSPEASGTEQDSVFLAGGSKGRNSARRVR